MLKVLGDRLGDADAAAAGAEEQDLLVLERDAVERERADRTGEDDGARALDVVCRCRRKERESARGSREGRGPSAGEGRAQEGGEGEQAGPTTHR